MPEEYPSQGYAPEGYPPEAEMSQPSGTHVRAEEVGLVLLVLLLWAGAVALFFNRWGKVLVENPRSLLCLFFFLKFCCQPEQRLRNWSTFWYRCTMAHYF